jgi:putative sigma-54 modulation protein
MIKNLTITGQKYELTDTTKRYVEKKIGGLGKYLPRHARKSAAADVKIRQINNPGGNKYEVEVIINVPEKVITAKDSTMNVLAAVDIVEAKLNGQIRKYKQSSVPHIGFRGALGRFKRSYQREK